MLAHFQILPTSNKKCMETSKEHLYVGISTLKVNTSETLPTNSIRDITTGKEHHVQLPVMVRTKENLLSSKFSPFGGLSDTIEVFS